MWESTEKQRVVQNIPTHLGPAKKETRLQISVGQYFQHNSIYKLGNAVEIFSQSDLTPQS